MLQSIRERAHGWFAWILFSLISITFIFWGVQSYTGGSVSDVAATVNGTDIHQSELQLAYERLRAQQQFQLGVNSITPEIEQQLKQQALQELIVSNVLSQAAHAEGLRFTLEQAIANVRLMPTFQTEGQFSPEKFKQVLAGLSYSEEQFIANLQSAMLINQMRVGFINSAFALPNEVEIALKLIKQRRDIKYLLIAAKNLTTNVSVSPAEVQAYYQQHKDNYLLPEQVSIEYLELSLKNIKSTQQFTEIQLKQFYEANPNSFIRQGKLQPFESVERDVLALMQQQKAEQLFAEQGEKLANLTFSNPASLAVAAKALKLPIQQTGLFTSTGAKNGIAANPKVVTAAFSHDVLKQGNNSAVIELDPQHVVVIRVKEHKPAEAQPLAAVRDAIYKKLLLQKSQALASKISHELADKLTKGNNINTILKLYGLTWITKTQVGRYDNGIPSQILAKAFQQPVSTAKQIIASDVALAAGDYAVVITDGIVAGKADVSAAEKHVFKEQLEHLNGQFDYGLYVDSVFQKAKVKVKP